jgi:hypothetical protein
VSPRRILQIVGTAELVTLVLMFANIVTAHRLEISRVLGPVHGLAYTATLITAVLVAGGRHRVWLLALVPGIGGLLAARVAPVAEPRPEGPPSDGVEDATRTDPASARGALDEVGGRARLGDHRDV